MTSSSTIRDVMRYAMPVGTRIVAGLRGIARPVTWVTALNTRLPAFPSLEGRELALISIDSLRQLSDKLTLADLIADLASLQIAGFAILGAIDNRARLAADEHGIPLLALPPGTILRQLERDVVSVLVGPLPAPETRAQEIHAQLLQLTTENKGMAALIGALSDLAGCTVVVQDKRQEVIAASGMLRDRPEWPEIEGVLADLDTLPESLRDREGVAQLAPDPAQLDLPTLEIHRLVMPIIANRMGRGHLSLLSRADFDALDVQLARYGAAVCALEMAKEKAVREAQKKVQGSILERFLQGEIQVDQAMRQLTRLNHNPNASPYAAIVVGWGAEPDQPSERRLEAIFKDTITALGSDAVVQLMDKTVVVFCAVEPNFTKALPRAVRQLVDSATARIKQHSDAARPTIGIGRPVSALLEWRTSYIEAMNTQRIATQWKIYEPVYFADLGVYRLLSLLQETPEIKTFYRETLGDLADEQYAHDEFITTMEAFFFEHGNLSQTANRLHVHRNTLLYRMERIEQIGGFDLDNPETRLAVFLALKIRRLLQTAGF